MAPEIGKFLIILWYVIVVMVIIMWIKSCFRCKKAEDLPETEGRQDNDVWNISGRVNGMDTWPTHDHHVSIDSFAFPPEYQAKDPRNAPPPYTEVDLPTYEEAILACQNQKNNLQVVVPIHMGQTESNEPHQH